ncbi:Cyclin-D5-1 [Zea mays]|uniref:Cyclin-D5-1 n=1 Tax=Zea mays TaxID=4577 RepID=A0A3L6ENM3_MAIZE|nr:Cyclin-D5-1 [Zea mays]
MGEEEERCSAGAGCSFSLTCLEDGADLDTDGGKLAASLYGDAEEDQEYMNHLVSKESSFCRSPSSSSCSPVVSDAGAETCPCPSSMAASSHEWFRCARRATVEWVFETRAYFGFSHRTAYLAVSYMDRFCLHRCMDVRQLSAIQVSDALGGAAASGGVRVPGGEDGGVPRADDEYDFSSVSIRRMELLVLSTLGWRMGDVTPLDYLRCLSSSRLRRGGDGGLVAAKAAALIFSTAEAASVLDYRPSTVAVAAVLAAAHGAMTKEALESKMSSLSLSSLLDKHDDAERALVGDAEQAADGQETGSIGAGTPYESVDADSSSFAAAADSNKRARLVELPAVGR